jgi:hypothetical protein
MQARISPMRTFDAHRMGGVAVGDGDEVAIDGNNDAALFEGFAQRDEHLVETPVFGLQVGEAHMQNADLLLQSVDDAVLHLIGGSGETIFEGEDAAEDASDGEKHADDADDVIHFWHDPPPGPNRILNVRSIIIWYIERARRPNAPARCWRSLAAA